MQAADLSPLDRALLALFNARPLPALHSVEGDTLLHACIGELQRLQQAGERQWSGLDRFRLGVLQTLFELLRADNQSRALLERVSRPNEGNPQ